jgi:glutamine cyclotransferase
MKILYSPLITLLFIWGIVNVNSSAASATTIPALDVEILDTQAHNPNSFIQGWIKEGDHFFESSGQYGRSFIQRYNHQSTTTVHLPGQYFAEGLTVIDDTVYLLTWKAGTLLLLDKASLAIKQRIAYQGEGWGLTHDGKELIMSNGSAELLFRNRRDFTITRRITVKLPVQLNELEYVKGVIWANNWKEDRLYAINSHNGCILGTLDLSSLRTQAKHSAKADVLNGIAYDSTRNALWVTGKYWPERYLINLPKVSGTADKGC